MENWFCEMHTPNVKLCFRVKEELAHVKSRYQDIHLYDTYEYGKMLVIDGTVQLTERDEYIYHEMIVHVPMLTHPNPQKILIIGGGDGGAAREALKHNPMRVDVVDIDEEVVRICRKHLPQIAKSYDDPRVHLHIQDGVKFIRENKNYDVIIVDSTDPVGPAEALFREEFYQKLKKSLNPNGVISQQCGTPIYHPEEVCNAYKILRKVFRFVKIYLAFIPTYPSGMWSFIIASDEPIIRRRDAKFKTRYYNDSLYNAVMILPDFVKEYCEEQSDD